MMSRTANMTGLAAGAALTAALAAASTDGLSLRFDRLNGVYENLESEVAPIRASGATIRLASPAHRLQLESNELRLTRMPDGRHRARGIVRFSGEGTVRAELDFGGLPAMLEDRVEFPVQEVAIEGTLRVERSETAYRVTAEELPPFTAIEMRSRLASELVSLCEGLAIFIAGDAGCGDLRELLERPRLPLPEPGKTFQVSFEDLTAAERARIDDYLRGP
jgi:hypothetical protein